MITLIDSTKMHDSILNAVVIPAVEEGYFKKIKFIIGPPDLNQGSRSRFIKISQYFYQNGFRVLQIITENPSIIRKIKEYCGEAIIIGGGHIGSIEEATNFLDNQSDYIIVGRLFARKPGLVKNYLKLFGKRLIVSIGDKNGLLAHNENIRTEGFAKRLEKLRLKNVLYMNDEARLTGNMNLKTFKKVRNIMRSSNIGYSGGVSSLNHLKMLKSLGANFVVVGTSLYTGLLNYRSAIELSKNEN